MLYGFCSHLHKKIILFISILIFINSPAVYSQTCTGSLGDPIVNITFGQGANPGAPLSTSVPGASTSYQYVTPTGNPPSNIVLDGDYAIINGVPSNPGWLQGGDHTNNGNGYLAFFNAAPNPGDFYHQTISGLCPGTTYEFAAWILNAINTDVISGAVPPNVTFKIFDPVDLVTPLITFSTGDIPESNTIIWRRYSTLFTTPAGINDVLLTLSNNNIGGTVFEGNDLAIDDITFRACGPLTNASFSGISSVTSLNLCNNVAYTLYGTVSSGLNNPAYQWQVSTDNGNIWSNITGATNLNYTSPGSPVGTYTYRLISQETANIGSLFCNFYSNLIQLTVSLLTINAGLDTAFCSNSAVTHVLHGNTSGTGYTWTPVALLDNNGLQNPTATVSGTTTFYVTTSNASCTAIDSVKITVNPLPAVSTINDFSVCKLDSTLLVTSGNANTYQWTAPLSVNNPTISSPHFTDTVSQQLIVTGTFTATGCFAKDTINITIKSIPDIRSIPDTSLCGAHNVTLATTGGQTYSWLPATGLSNPGIANPTYTGNSTQTYIVTGTAANACKANDTITITINNIPVVSTINNTGICKGDSILLLTNSNAQVNHWTPVISVTNPNISNPYFIDTISQTLTLTGTNTSTGCFSTTSVVITVKPTPTVKSIDDFTSCSTNTVTLTTIGAPSYSWNPVTNLDDPNSANPVFTGSVGIYTYYVTGTATNGCIAKDTVTVTIASTPVFTAPLTKTICLYDSVQLDGNNGPIYAYQWSPATHISNTNIMEPMADPLITTNYTLVITDHTCNYDSTFSVRVTVNSLPLVNATKSNDLDCASLESQLIVSGALQYNWIPATGLSNSAIYNPVASPYVTTQYIVTGTDNNGCNNKDTLIVYRKGGKYFGFNIPNSFTPNRDGINDCFGVTYWGETKNFHLMIYNRLGEKVFETRDVSECWNGNYKDIPSENGNYVYYLNGETLCGKVNRKGNVLLIR
jgi:gliding motility-associated-like protein